jgi:hypothetical protein
VNGYGFCWGILPDAPEGHPDADDEHEEHQSPDADPEATLQGCWTGLDWHLSGGAASGGHHARSIAAAAGATDKVSRTGPVDPAGRPAIAPPRARRAVPTHPSRSARSLAGAGSYNGPDRSFVGGGSAPTGPLPRPVRSVPRPVHLAPERM